VIRSIIDTSLKFRLLVLVIATGLIAVGIAQVRAMPVDVLPEFTPPYVEIQTEALGLSAEEVEQLITVPLEQDLLNGVAWVDIIRSESVPGLSSIVLYFQPGTDPMRARQMVAERLTQAFALPHVSKAPTMLQPLSSTSRVVMVGLSTKDRPLTELGVLARWTIAPRLMGVPGVANVAIWGQRDRQLQVLVDPKQLHDKGVTLEQIIETTGNSMWVSSLSFVEASVPGTGGFIDTPQQRLGIRHIFPISSAASLAQVPVEDSAWTLGDVATVVEDHQPLIGDAITNDAPGLLLVVEKLPGANTLDVTRGVEEALEAMRPGLPGIQMDSSIYRPATYIEMALANLSQLLLIGAVLAAVVLLAFAWQWRVALISLVAIASSLVAAVFVLYQRGATLNAMVLVGLVIALGAVVDDAITDADHIARRLRQPRPADSDRSPAAIVLEAAVEMRSAAIYATLIILLAALPLFFIEDVWGAFFKPLALSYVLAVLVSMLVALIVTPALCLTLLANAPLERRQSPFASWLQRGYQAILAQTVRMPRLATIVAAVALLAGLAMVPFFRQSLLPSFREPNLLIHFDGAPGTSQPEMDRIVAKASRELRSIPGVRNVGAHVGRAVMSDQVVGINSSELWVSIDPAADYDATLRAIDQAIDAYPGFRRDAQTYLNERSRQAVAGTGDSLVVRVYGDDRKTLRSTADEVKQALTGIAGVAGAQVKLPVEEPTLEIQVDLAAAQRYGIKPGDVRRAAATLLSGLQVGNLFEEQKVFDVVVWGTPETRSNLTSIRDLLIDTPNHEQVRLGDVAQVRIVPSPTVIKHDAVRGYLDISVSVSGRDRGAVVADIERHFQDIKFPLEYHAEVVGEQAGQQAALQRLIGVVLAAVIGAFLLLQAAFGSWRLASVTILTLPVALVGGALAAFAAGGVISLGSLVGFFTVLGIAARNGVALINHYQQLEQQEGEAFGPELVLRGSRERVAPIVTTALVTAAALAPLAIAGGVPGNEVVQSAAVVILGGLVTSALLNLFVIPALYLRFGSSPVPAASSAPIGDQPALDVA